MELKRYRIEYDCKTIIYPVSKLDLMLKEIETYYNNVDSQMSYKMYDDYIEYGWVVGTIEPYPPSINIDGYKLNAIDVVYKLIPDLYKKLLKGYVELQMDYVANEIVSLKKGQKFYECGIEIYAE